MWQSAPPAGGSAEAQTSTVRECLRAHTGAVLRDLTSYRRAVGLCIRKDLEKSDPCKKDRVHNRASTPSGRVKQDHFAKGKAAESASARNRQRDGVQGYDKRLMRGFCMCFEDFQSKVIHAKKTASKSVHVRPHGVQRRSLGAVAKCACVQSKWAFLGAPTSDRSAVFASASNRFQTKRSSQKNRVQNRALTPSWRSKLAERLRGQHRY